MEIFGRASWLMFAAGALPTGLAGWWIGSRVGASSPVALGLIALSSAFFSIGASLLAWRWFVAPLRELERGLDRWTRGDLSTPLDDSKMSGWRGLARQFSRAQLDLHHVAGRRHHALAHPLAVDAHRAVVEELLGPRAREPERIDQQLVHALRGPVGGDLDALELGDGGAFHGREP